MGTPETNFRRRIERRLPRALHREKMANPYLGGTADAWYSGKKGDLWIEYKFLSSVPQRGIITAKRLGLTPLQLEWLNGRYEEGRNVAVVVGIPGGGIILRDLLWAKETPVDVFVSWAITDAGITQWIVHKTFSE